MSEQPVASDPRVDAAVARLADLDGKPVAEHVEIFEDVQRRLQEALDRTRRRDLTGCAGPASTPSSFVGVWPARASRPRSWSPRDASASRGRPATKAATQVDPATSIVVTAERRRDDVRLPRRPQARRCARRASRTWLSSGRRALDAGASTGGFTDVLLRRGVGRGRRGRRRLRPARLERCSSDPRVTVVDRTNVRDPDRSSRCLAEPVDLVVADLSFISLGLVLPALVGGAAPDADLARSW